MLWLNQHCLLADTKLCLATLLTLSFAVLFFLIVRSSMTLQTSLVFSSDDDDPLILLSAAVSWSGLRLSLHKALGQPKKIRVQLGGWTVWQARQNRKVKASDSEQKSTKQELEQAKPSSKPGFVVRQIKKLSIDWSALWPWLWHRVAEIDLHELRGNLDFSCADPACTGQLDAFFWALRGILPGHFFQHQALYGKKILRSDVHLALSFRPFTWLLLALWWLGWHLRWRPAGRAKIAASFI